MDGKCGPHCEPEPKDKYDHCTCEDCHDTSRFLNTGDR